MTANPASLQRHLCQQYFRHGALANPHRLRLHLRHGGPVSNISATAPRSATSPTRRRGQQHLRHGAAASNKPHLAEKSSPVWLAIWRNWAGFANSQHRDAAFATLDKICAHSSLLQTLSSCSDITNLSAHLHRLPTPPPYLRQMRLSHGRGAGIRWVIRLSLGRDASVRWVIRLLPGRMRRSCKSPRARIPVLGTSGAHWPARWPRFELTERVAKS